MAGQLGPVAAAAEPEAAWRAGGGEGSAGDPDELVIAKIADGLAVQAQRPGPASCGPAAARLSWHSDGASHRLQAELDLGPAGVARRARARVDHHLAALRA